MLRPPSLCGLPHCLCIPLGLDPIVYADIHLSHRERTRCPNYIERGGTVNQVLTIIGTVASVLGLLVSLIALRLTWPPDGNGKHRK